ncbi:MAG TPA: acyl-ACP desaturase [Planctomycetota bacterium]|nr:acyl-ACP desaturase [Planctomycetota bacterium]
MVFGALTKHLVRLAVPYITLEDAKERHSKRKHLASQFDFAAIRRDWDAGNISHECKNWLDLMIMTEAGTPVYTAMLTALEDANRPEFESFRRFVLEVWNREEEEHGECAIELAKAMRMDFDPESVRDKADWAKGYFDACPPCKRVLGTTVYTVIQEEMTYHSHRAYAECSGSAELARMGQTIAAEERYHSYFYASRLRDVLAVVQKDGMSEDEAFATVVEVIERFQMPTKFHSKAYARLINPEKGLQAMHYFKKQKGAIKRQLGPIFAAAGGWKLVRAVVNARTVIGNYSEADAAEYASAPS